MEFIPHIIVSAGMFTLIIVLSRLTFGDEHLFQWQNISVPAAVAIVLIVAVASYINTIDLKRRSNMTIQTPDGPAPLQLYPVPRSTPKEVMQANPIPGWALERLTLAEDKLALISFEVKSPKVDVIDRIRSILGMTRENEKDVRYNLD